MYKFRWKPSKSSAREFAQKMDEIDEFCSKHGISRSYSCLSRRDGIRSYSLDSYYFAVNNQRYRVSSHNKEGREEPGIIYIQAEKTRIIEIYNDLINGYTLDGHGNRTKEEAEDE